MTNITSINGYRAAIRYDPDIAMFRGEFVDINGSADFYATDVAGLQREAAKSLQIFLRMCREDQVEPRRTSGALPCSATASSDITTTDDGSRFLQKLLASAKSLTRAWGWLSLAELTKLGLFAIAALFVIEVTRPSDVLLETFFVSKHLEEMGYTPDAISRFMIDSIRSVRYEDNLSNQQSPASVSNAPQDNNSGELDQGEEVPAMEIALDDVSAGSVDAVVPFIGASISSFAKYVRITLGRLPFHATRLIVVSGELLYAETESGSEITMRLRVGDKLAFDSRWINEPIALEMFDEVAPLINCQLDVNYYILCAKLFNSRGVRLDREGEYIRAIKQYMKAVELQWNNPRPHYNWGLALRKLDDYDGAIKKYEIAIDIDPDYVNAYINWGVALTKQGDHAGAIRKYQKVIDIDPDYAIAYNNWGVALAKQEKYRRAIRKYQKATDIDPDYAIAYNNWGLALAKLDDHKGAIEKYAIALDIDPDYAAARNNMKSAKEKLD